MEHDYDGVAVRIPGPMYPDLFDGESPILQDLTVYGYKVEATFFRNPEQQDDETPPIRRVRTMAATCCGEALEFMGEGVVRAEFPRACDMEFEVEDEECTERLTEEYVARMWAAHRAAQQADVGI